MSEFHHLKPCQHVGHGDRVCGKTPTIKITEFEYEKIEVVGLSEAEQSWNEKIVGIKYFCIDHIRQSSGHGRNQLVNAHSKLKLKMEKKDTSP
jgi:hypothetical protein